jgi:hypothetical protein
MDNPVTQAILGTRDRTKTSNNKNGEKTHTTQNTEGAIKNGQFRNTGNSKHKRQQIPANPPPKKTHTHTYRKFEKKVSNAKALKIVGEPWCWRRISSSCFLKETRRATYIVKSGKSLVSDIEKHRIYMKRKRSIAI